MRVDVNCPLCGEKVTTVDVRVITSITFENGTGKGFVRGDANGFAGMEHSCKAVVQNQP